MTGRSICIHRMAEFAQKYIVLTLDDLLMHIELRDFTVAHTISRHATLI